MASRISTDAVVSRLGTGLGALASIVEKSTSNTFLNGWDRTYPAVWVMGQKSERIDTGRGTTGTYRQHVGIFITIRAVVQKYGEGMVSNEEALNTLVEAVNDLMLGWRPADALKPFVYDSSNDGPVFDNILATDLVYVTESVFNKNTPVY